MVSDGKTFYPLFLSPLKSFLTLCCILPTLFPSLPLRLLTLPPFLLVSTVSFSFLLFLHLFHSPSPFFLLLYPPFVLLHLHHVFSFLSSLVTVLPICCPVVIHQPSPAHQPSQADIWDLFMFRLLILQLLMTSGSLLLGSLKITLTSTVSACLLLDFLLWSDPGMSTAQLLRKPIGRALCCQPSLLHKCSLYLFFYLGICPLATNFIFLVLLAKTMNSSLWMNPIHSGCAEGSMLGYLESMSFPLFCWINVPLQTISIGAISRTTCQR